MGAVAGIFLKTNEAKNDKEKIKKTINQSIDVSFNWEDEDVLIGVSYSKISLQSNYESGPIVDADFFNVVAAEAILENRVELLKLLNLPMDQLAIMSDSLLIMKAYSNWGNACFERLVGTFAIVLYNYKTKEIVIVRDQIGSSKLYYIVNEDFLAFSSSISTLLPLLPKKAALNDLWIANYLTVNTPMHDVISTQTIYQQINQLDPGCFITSSKTESSIIQFSKFDIYPKAEISYEKACSELKNKLNSVVEGMVKSQGNVGIMLSGGLDSTTVAVFASQALEKVGKKLFAYTSVPLESFVVDQKLRKVQNESKYVDAFLKMYPNIEHKYIYSKGKSSITDIDEHLMYLEEPYKFIENYFWLNEILEAAKNDGCTTLLNGSYGNVTISYGPIHERLATLNSEGKFIKSFLTLNQFSKLSGIGRKRAYKYFFELLFQKPFPTKLRFDYENLYINKSLARSLSIEQLHKKFEFGQYTNQKMTTYDLRKFFVAPNLISQNASNTSCALKRHGIQILDPTGDLRVVDFCFSLPLDYFVKDGKERQLIRDMMLGDLPDEIRLNYLKKGIQSADWLFRLEPEITTIRNELTNLLKEPFGRYYFDVEQLNKDLEGFEVAIQRKDIYKVRMIIISFILAKFLKNHFDI